MCALELVYPDLGPVPDQYLLGEHLLVAPVLEPDCRSRRVVLPPGRWTDLFDPARSFAGPAVIRNVGRYLTEHKATVGAFYISNVETYLSDPQKQTFYENVTTLPVDSSSMFIRHILGNPARGLSWWRPGMTNVSTIAPMSEFINQIKSGRRPTFQEIVRETKDPNVLGGVSR